jgi:hypothetical protein
MKNLILTSILACGSCLLNGQIVSYTFDEVLGTSLTGTSPSAGSINWSSNLTNVATNGLGSLVNTGSSGGASHLDIADLSSGVYHLKLSGVQFAGIGGGSDDVVGLAFRSFDSGAIVGGSSSDTLGLVVGNINNGGELDAVLRVNGSDFATVNDFANTAGSYDFYIQFDLDNDLGSIFYDSGSGVMQLGPSLTGVTNAAIQVGFSHSVVDFGGGDQILVGGLSLNEGPLPLAPVPEPSTYALFAGLGALVLIWRRRRTRG